MQNESASPVAAENIQPVRFLKTDDRLAHPTPGVALCLSGGGYRAMLFHLGALWRLNDAGLLRGLVRISSVSGGSYSRHAGPCMEETSPDANDRRQI